MAEPPKPSPWLVYILECKDQTLYTGCTPDIKQRLAKHNSGLGAKYTASRFPVKLVYCETCSNKSAALKREHQIKQLSRSEKLALISLNSQVASGFLLASNLM